MQCREAHNNDAVQNREWQQEEAECHCLHAYVLWCCLLCLSMFVALRRIHSNKKRQQNAWHSGPFCLRRWGCRTQAHPNPKPNHYLSTAALHTDSVSTLQHSTQIQSVSQHTVTAPSVYRTDTVGGNMNGRVRSPSTALQTDTDRLHRRLCRVARQHPEG